MTMSLISDELGQASTKKKEFLGIMEKLIPWSQWVGIVQPHYYKGERGNKPYDLELMLRIYVLQHLYNLADDAARNEIIDSRAFSQFCGVDSSNQVPDGDTIGRFRHILERNQLGEAFFTNVVENLQKCNLMLKKGTIVDSTLIAAPSSTKNKEKQRDPEAHSVKKGNQWYFGYKEHIGVMRTADWFTRWKQQPPMCTTATWLPSFCKEQRRMFMVTAGIWVQKRRMMQFLSTMKDILSGIKSTSVRRS